MNNAEIQQPDSISLIAPDDWHVHLRDGHYLERTVSDVARQFQRAIVMPNLRPPVVTMGEALAYRARILAAVPKETCFTPLMTLYLTQATRIEDVEQAANSDSVFAVKFYPAGATTHADWGVSDIKQATAVLAAMEKHGLPLLIHGEINDAEVDIFDRERYFLERELTWLLQAFPGLKLVLEHITTAEAVDFVEAAPAQLAATITAHHLLVNRNDMLVGGVRPHLYCLPILKRACDQAALLKAATSGSSSYFLGSDSAPHAIGKKETCCGCAGIYTGFSTMALYAEAFEAAGALDKLEGFASFYGPDFYGLPRNQGHIRLKKQPFLVPEQLRFGDEQLVPFRAGEQLAWQLDVMQPS